MTSQAKLCSLCLIEQPVDNFRKRAKSSERRHSYCYTCQNGYRRQRQAVKRRGELHQFSQLLASGRLDNCAVVKLCDEMFKRFGGVQGFASTWKRELDAAMQEKPGQRFILNSLTSVLRL